MPDFKKLLLYLLLFCLAYLGLTLLFSTQSIQNNFTENFRGGSEWWLNFVFPKADFYVKKDDSAKAANETGLKILFVNPAEIERLKKEAIASGATKLNVKPPAVLRLDVTTSFTVLLAFLWSLILLTPIPLVQRLIAFISGTILLILVVALRIYFIGKAGLVSNPVGVYEASGFWASFYQTIAAGWTMGVNVFFVLLIWILVAFAVNGQRLTVNGN